MRNIARAVAILGVLALVVATVPAVGAQVGGGQGGPGMTSQRDQTRDLSRTRERIQDCLDGLNQAVGATDPDPQRVSERAGELAQVMETWQKQYQRLGEDMGVRFGREGL